MGWISTRHGCVAGSVYSGGTTAAPLRYSEYLSSENTRNLMLEISTSITRRVTCGDAIVLLQEISERYFLLLVLKLDSEVEDVSGSPKDVHPTEFLFEEGLDINLFHW